MQNAVDGVVARLRYHFKAQHPIRRQTTGRHLVPLATFHRNGFTGQGALVKRTELIEQAGVGRQAGTRSDFDNLAGTQLIGADLFPHLALGSGTDPQRLVRHQRHQSGHSGPGASGGVGLQMFTQHKEQQHHGRFGGFTEKQGAHGGHRHQGLDGEGGAAFGQRPRLARDRPQPPEGRQGKERLTELARQQGGNQHQTRQ